MRIGWLICLISSLHIIGYGQSAEVETVIQKGHLQQVLCSDFHPTGLYVATGSADFSVKLWNVQTGKEIRSYTTHTDKIRTVQFSADGKLLLTASRDNTARIFEVVSGKQLVVYELTRDDLISAHFVAGDTYFLVSDNRDKAYLCRTSTGEELATVKKSYSSALKSAHATKDGNQILDLINYKGVRIVPLNTESDTVTISFDKPHSMEFGPNGKRVVVGSTKLFAKVFDSKSGEELFHLEDDEDNRCDGCNMEVCYSKTGKFIATGTRKTNLVLWNGSNGKKIHQLEKLEARPTEISFSADDKYVMVASDETIKVFDTKSGKPVFKKENELFSYFKPEFSIDNKLALPDEHNTASVWKIPSGIKETQLKGYLNEPRTDKLRYSYSRWTDVAVLNAIKNKTEIALSPDGQWILQSKIDTIARIISAQTGKVKHVFRGHSQQVIAVAFSPDGTIAATGSGDGKIKLWQTSSGAEIRTISGHVNVIFDLKFNKTGNQIVSGSWDGTMRVWDVKTGNELLYQELGNNSPYEVDFGPSDLYIAQADMGKSLNIVEVDSKENFRSLIGHTGKVADFAWSFNHSLMASASWDGTVKVWDWNTGMLKSKHSHHNGAVLSVACHPNKMIGFSGGADRTIRVFELETGKEIEQLIGHSNSVSSISISEKSGIIVSCSVDGEIKVWDLDKMQELFTYISVDRENWLVKNKFGYFDGTKQALKLINYVSGLESLSVGSFFKKYHSPSLQQRIMDGEQFNDTGDNIHELIRSAPNLEATFKDFQNQLVKAQTDSTYKASRKELTLKVEVTGTNDPDLIRVFNNGKLTEEIQFSDEVNFRGAKKSERELTIELAPGDNTLDIVAISNTGVESTPRHFTLSYDKEAGETDLYLLVLGVNKYRNPKYVLNYAKNDAQSFLKTIEKNAEPIFHSTHAFFLADEQVNKQEVKQTFDKIASEIGPEDVFVMYYAGHGVMTEKDMDRDAEFFLVTSDITNLFGDDITLREKAISARELLTYSREIAAQKQLFVIDACQSGGALTAFATRGAPREKALAQLARSSGTFFLTASQDAQYANEVGDLKHGIFTYAILEILTGEVSEYRTDEKITVSEIKSYVESRVPELSKQYHGSEQFPTSYSFGQDFPLAVFR